MINRNFIPVGAFQPVVTGTNFTLQKCEASVYKKLNDNYWMDFQLYGTVNATNGVTLTFPGIVFSSEYTFQKVNFGSDSLGVTPNQGLASPGASTILIGASGNFTAIVVHGSVALNSKPTFME